MMKVLFNDGGRSASGRKGLTGDCVARSIAIAMQLPYDEVYDIMANGCGTQRRGKYGKKKGFTASNGVNTNRKWFKDFMASKGWKFTATMGIGTGCKVHLKDGELPMGRLIVNVSKHMVAVIDGVINDTHDPSRDGTRCVYGYWSKA